VARAEPIVEAKQFTEHLLFREAQQPVSEPVRRRAPVIEPGFDASPLPTILRPILPRVAPPGPAQGTAGWRNSPDSYRCSPEKPSTIQPYFEELVW
jgi:hypothetical protein